MNDMAKPSDVEEPKLSTTSSRTAWPRWAGAILLALAAGAGFWFWDRAGNAPAQASAPAALPEVTVSAPLKRSVDTRVGFLGQFSAVNEIEVRAQVGGTLTEIHFQDGQIVHKGDLLFVIDPRPYEIRLTQAKAALETAQARLILAKAQLGRTQRLRPSGAVSADELDARTAEQTAAQAAIDDSQALIRDAQLDLEYSRVTAPFTGRIGARQVSIGALIAGSRAGTGPSTLLTTLVSLDPIYLNFDMSEADYLLFSRERAKLSGELANKVEIALSDEDNFTRQGSLDFVDNALDHSSGTMRARATVANPDLFLTPGAFARLRLSVAPPAPSLLVPDVAVLLDQSQRIVMTVADDGTVVPKPVETGDLRGGLRIIRSGLTEKDRVIIDGIMRAVAGAKVTPREGAINASTASDGQG
jgi:membrane fusion protein, multidrug efflux system